MSNRKPTPKPDREIEAMKKCYDALLGLKKEEQIRVIQWLGRKLNIPMTIGMPIE